MECGGCASSEAQAKEDDAALACGGRLACQPKRCRGFVGAKPPGL